MEDCLLRIDYRMVKENFTESEMWKEKKIGLLRRENKIAGGVVIAIFTFANTTLKALFLAEGDSRFTFASFVFDFLIFLLLIAVIFHIPFKIIKRNRMRLFTLRELDKKPCYIEFYEEYMKYSIDSAEDVIPYEKIKFIRESSKTFSVLLRESHECISIPKQSLSGDTNDRISSILYEKAESVFHNSSFSEFI